MKEKLAKRIRDLALIEGLSGHEQKVSAYMKAEFEKNGLSVRVDPLGNTITSILGKGKYSILVTSHMDSLGFVVKNITADGFLKLERVGGIPEKTLAALQVSVVSEEGKAYPGVIGVKSHHLTSAEEKYKVDHYQELYVDLGTKSKEEVLALGIDVGCPIVYQPAFIRLQNDRVSGTSFDDRVACAIVLELAERFAQKPALATVHLAGTVQEEYTIRGATLAARSTKPDLVVCLDIILDGSTPDLAGVTPVAMGQGPVLNLYNFHGRGTLNGVIPHPALVRHFQKVAKDKQVKLQKNVMLGGLSELAYMQLEGEGLPGLDFGFPCRYTHSCVETVDLNDVVATADFLEAAIRAIDDDFDFSR